MEYRLGCSYHLYKYFIFFIHVSSPQCMTSRKKHTVYAVWLIVCKKKSPEQTHSTNMLVLSFTHYKQTLIVHKV